MHCPTSWIWAHWCVFSLLLASSNDSLAGKQLILLRLPICVNISSRMICSESVSSFSKIRTTYFSSSSKDTTEAILHDLTLKARTSVTLPHVSTAVKCVFATHSCSGSHTTLWNHLQTCQAGPADEDASLETSAETGLAASAQCTIHNTSNLMLLYVLKLKRKRKFSISYIVNIRSSHIRNECTY